MYLISFVLSSKSICPYMCESVSGFSIIFHWFFCLSWCQQHTVWTTVGFYNKSWNQVVLVLQVCSSFAELCCPFQVLCIFVLKLESACQCLKKSSQVPNKYLVPTSDAQWVTVQCDGWKNYYLTGVKLLGLPALCSCIHPPYSAQNACFIKFTNYDRL